MPDPFILIVFLFKQFQRLHSFDLASFPSFRRRLDQCHMFFTSYRSYKRHRYSLYPHMMWEVWCKTYISDAENYPMKSAKPHDQTLPMTCSCLLQLHIKSTYSPLGSIFQSFDLNYFFVRLGNVLR